MKSFTHIKINKQNKIKVIQVNFMGDIVGKFSSLTEAENVTILIAG